MLEEAGQTDEENEDFLEPLNEDPFVPISFKEFLTRWSKNQPDQIINSKLLIRVLKQP